MICCIDGALTAREVIQSGLHPQLLFDAKVHQLHQLLSLQLAVERERVLEDFLVSGAMLRDLSVVEERGVVHWSRDHGLPDCVRIRLEIPWRVR